MDGEEQEMESDSTLLYPSVADSDDELELQTGSTYLFPDSEFEPDAGESTQTSKSDLVRDCIIRDILSLILQKVIPDLPAKPADYVPPPIKRNPLLSRDEIIHQAMEQAYLSRRGVTQPLQTRTLVLERKDFSRKPKLPPIKLSDDPDLRELMEKGKSKGYSEAAILKTRRDNNTHRLLIPSKEEAETVDVWRLEEQYRSSIRKLRGYTL